MISHPSPNFNERPAELQGKAKFLILHYTGMARGAEALARLCDPQAQVSAHYLIEEDGRIFSLVAEDKRAWHAGISHWAGETDINGHSIGIELVNPGHDSPGYTGNYRPFPEGQMAALIPLCQSILARHPIVPDHVLGHSDVAPARKIDPGELFDWRRLAEAGIGVWPEEDGFSQRKGPVDIGELQQKLRQYGYGIDVTGKEDTQTEAVVGAFHRHFRPKAHGQPADRRTIEILDCLARLKGGKRD